MTNTVSRFVRLAIALGAVPLAAQAQEALPTMDRCREIVVTAQKREESLRDVPLSVEAVSGAKLAEAGIVRLEDLKSYVPNLQMSETGIANNIYIRGIGSGLNQGFEQSVSIYMDGIYRGRGHQSRMPFLDLERVEVLRGPQPILFGKNAVAGAVNMVGARPTRSFEGMCAASYDFENNDIIASADASAARSASAFGARLAVHDRTADGYVDNLTLGRDEPARDEIGGAPDPGLRRHRALSLSWRTEGGSYDTQGPPDRDLRRNPHHQRLAGRAYLQPDRRRSGPPLPQGQNPTRPQQRPRLQALVQWRQQRHVELRDGADRRTTTSAMA